MPELPEIHTIVTDLKRYVNGSTITKTALIDNYRTKTDHEAFILGTENKKIADSDRIAKNILLKLSNNKIVVIHLAMTGNLLLRDPQHPQEKWTRVIFSLNKNSKNYHLRYSDMRMFGKVQLLSSQEEIEQFKNQFGPEPLENDLTPKKFLSRLQSKKSNIKNVMLDQKIIAGMGNVYVNDALWIAKIHPETNTKDLTIEQADLLLNASKEILNEGIKNRGISMSDYVDLFGKKGNQQNYFRVYQKEVCPKCNYDVEFSKLNNRGTYFCPNCQTKKPQSPLFKDEN